MQQFAGADALLQAIFGHSQGETELSGVSQGDPEALGEEQGFQGEEEELEAAATGGGIGGPELELDAEPEEVVRRIQSAALWFISQLAEGVLPDIELVSRTASNCALTAAGGDEGAEGNGEEGAGSRGGPRHFVLRLQQGTQCRSLVGRHPESAEQVARLWVLLGAVHAMLLSGEQATQRELWYRFKTLEVGARRACMLAVQVKHAWHSLPGPGACLPALLLLSSLSATYLLNPSCQVFRSPRDVNEAIQDAVSMLQVPRSALAITASSKGLVGGRLVIHNRRSGGFALFGVHCASCREDAVQEACPLGCTSIVEGWHRLGVGVMGFTLRNKFHVGCLQARRPTAAWRLQGWRYQATWLPICKIWPSRPMRS